MAETRPLEVVRAHDLRRAETVLEPCAIRQKLLDAPRTAPPLAPPEMSTGSRTVVGLAQIQTTHPSARRTGTRAWMRTQHSQEHARQHRRTFVGTLLFLANQTPSAMPKSVGGAVVTMALGDTAGGGHCTRGKQADVTPSLGRLGWWTYQSQRGDARVEWRQC